MDIYEENAIPAFLESTQLTFELESVDVYNTLLFPAQTKDYELNPQVEVPYNFENEQRDQKSVDEGHSPWRLDPLFTTQVFVSLQILPGGIKGEYPIEEDNLKLVYSTDDIAIVAVNDEDTHITTVYLKRLIRQDNSGIWTVVGYDHKDK
ncbi:hypothetical protein SAMN05880501_11066 [Ureibacillus xyleni]|uniref:Uncharacterized protein n=1 Tax=Ureibacillus xyleni TaxID=614648 RepID=A0A285TEI0_9BACL|nr:hypothetical protein [Ureibacillus xyleni]SOC18216.1 hypothetical protein SAMN05880501_11066 [Ureibacillus xyleni]